MAAKYGTNAQLRANVPAEAIPPGEAGGRVRLLYDKYSLPSAVLALNDTVDMGAPLPKGARVIDAMLKFADLGTTGTLKFGHKVSADGLEVADDDSFMTTVDLNTAADVIKASDNQAAPAAIGKKFAAEVQPQILVTQATTASTGDIESFILYVLD